jgi:hypothetical protein
MPARDDPQPVVNRERRELCFATPNPVGVGDLRLPRRWQRVDSGGARGLAQDPLDVRIMVEQRLEAIQPPGYRRVPLGFRVLRVIDCQGIDERLPRAPLLFDELVLEVVDGHAATQKPRVV